MTPESVKKMSPIPDDLFLVNQYFGEILLAAKMSGAREFRLDCRCFLDRLVDKIRQTVFCSSPVSQGLYCFCPELLLAGDDVVVFDLFAKHVGSLGRCGLWSSGEVTESKAEFLSYVVEARQWHVSGGTISIDVKNVVTYLMRQYVFQSRHCLMRVFQLCCLFIESQDVAPAFIDFDFSECAVRPGLLTSCLRSVQSFVSSSSYDQSSFFSSTTIDRVRQALGSADAFMEKTDFNPWEGVCTGDFVNLFRCLDGAYTSCLQEQVKSAESYYKTANIANCQVLVASPIVKFGTTQLSVGTSSVVSTKSVGKPQASNDDGGAFVKSVFGCGGCGGR